MVGPLVNAIEPVHGEALVELADADNTVIVPLIVEEAVASLVGAYIASIE